MSKNSYYLKLKPSIIFKFQNFLKWIIIDNYWVTSRRLSKMLDQFKQLVENKVLSKECMVTTLELIQASTTRTCSFNHDSFDSYVEDRKICFRRKLLCLWYCFLNCFAVIYFLICLVKSDLDTMRWMGSPVILITNHYNLINATGVTNAYFKCVAQLTINFYETQRQLFMIVCIGQQMGSITWSVWLEQY